MGRAACAICLVVCLSYNHIESADDDVDNMNSKSWKLYAEADAIMSSLHLFKLDEVNRAKDLDKQNAAISLFEKAASLGGNGSAPASFALGSIFSGSKGVPTDDPRWQDDSAFKYFKLAADKGTRRCQRLE